MKRLIFVTALMAAALSVALVPLGDRSAHAQESATVAVGDNFFDPATVTISAGGTVTWNWQGNLPHTVTANDGSFSSVQQTTGSYSFTFDTPGTYGYFCEVHGQVMSGTVVVQEAAGEQPTAPAAPTDDDAAPPETQQDDGAAQQVPATGTGGGDGGSGSWSLFVAALVALGGTGAMTLAYGRLRRSK